jgi:hypothetical protein
VDDGPEILMPPDLLGGAWANDALVYLTPHEVTIDFLRRDPYEDVAICVSRVSCSGILAVDLLDKLGKLVPQWAASSLPPEVFDALRERLPDLQPEEDEG